jgi:hypothetical protein
MAALLAPLPYLLFSVCFHVKLGGFCSVMGCVGVMSLGHMRVMRRRFVITFLMVHGSFSVVVGGMLMMLSCLAMMVRCFLRHMVFLSLARCRDPSLGLSSIVERNYCAPVSKT